MSPGAAFVPGAALSRAFYRDAVRPLLAGQPHAAALLGWGSDVLGYDTERSTDHGWGPRLLVLLPEAGQEREWTARLEERLPERFGGWPVRYGWDDVPPQHWVGVTTLAAWCQDHLGVDATAGLSTRDWLTVPQQRLLGVVAGAVHADPDGSLARLRAGLAWYPDDVWRWLVACQWARTAAEEAFVARTAEVGDDVGSAVVAARQTRELLRLALLLERRYAPYSKWLGTAFARLDAGDGLPGQLRAAVHAPDAERRQDALGAAYRSVAGRANATGRTRVVDEGVGSYHGRPAQVLMAGRFVQAWLETVQDPWLRGLPLVGAVDQLVDSSAVLEDPALCRRVAAVYGPGP